MRAVIRLMSGGDVDQARRRMRYAWLAGFIWAGISFFNAGAIGIGIIFGFDAEGQPQWSGGQLAFVLVESTLVASLAFGVLKRWRPAAVLLFFYFAISRIVLIALGLIALQQSADLLRLLVQVVVAYLFFQGIRGSLAFHYLTHPHYTAAGARHEEQAGEE